MDALFYPTLSLPGAAWTNPNLLFFDQIGIIAPYGEPRELFDGPTRTLIDYGLVVPVEPERFARDEQSDGHVVGHLLGMAQTIKGSDDFARIHLGKIAFSRLSSELRDLKLIWTSHTHEWLEGPKWVVDYLMSVLATRMALHPDLNASLVTNQRSSERLVTGSQNGRHTRWARRTRAVTRLLPVGPDAEIAEIMRFRERHIRELKSFRAYVEALIRRSPDGQDGDFDYEARLRSAEQVRGHLVGELEAVRSSVTPVSIALSIAGILAPALENSYYSVASAGGGLAYLLSTYGSARLRERAARSDKLVYAALASTTFSPRHGHDVLR